MNRTKAHMDFMTHGHKLASSNWDAWYCAFQYAEEVKSPLLPLIDKGCNYAEQMRPVPAKFLKAAEQLWKQSIDACRPVG